MPRRQDLFCSVILLSFHFAILDANAHPSLSETQDLHLQEFVWFSTDDDDPEEPAMDFDPTHAWAKRCYSVLVEPIQAQPSLTYPGYKEKMRIRLK